MTHGYQIDSHSPINDQDLTHLSCGYWAYGGWRWYLCYSIKVSLSLLVDMKLSYRDCLKLAD